MASTLLIASPTASVAGGVQTWLRELCVGLDRKRWRPVVALLRGTRAHDPAKYRASWPELETVEIDGRGLDAAGRVREVQRCIRRMAPEVFLPLTAIDAHHAICGLKLRGPSPHYLLTLQGNVPAQIADVLQLADFADLAVCPGRLTARMTEWAGVPAERVRYVPNGAAAPVTVRKPRLPGGPLRLGYVGRLSHGDKRASDLIALYRALTARSAHFELTIAGDGPLTEEINAALASEPNVHVLGRCTQEDLYRSVYPALDALLLFSESESFGIVVVEAMLHGIVPVTSRYVGQASEGLVSHGVTGLLFNVGDIVDATEQVLKLLSDFALERQLSDAARRSVVGRYDWGRCIDGWQQALDDVIELPLRAGLHAPCPSKSNGLLERLRVPHSLTDRLRQARVRAGWVPRAMLGGAEWPWIGRDHVLDDLEAIRLHARQLDCPTPPG